MPIKKWKILDQSVIFEHQRITLIEDTVQLPNQKVTKYLRFKNDGNAATIIAINSDGKILLQREYSHPPNEILFQFAGGGVPTDEDIYEGANRELMEECNLRGQLELIGECYYNNRRSDGKMYFFIATDLNNAELPSDEEEFIEHDWYTEAEIDTLIASGEAKNVFLLAGWAVFKQWRSKNSV